MSESVKDAEGKSFPYKKFVTVFWGLFLAGVLFVFLLFYGASEGWLGELPTFDEIENPRNNLATTIYSADGEELGKYFHENRSQVTYDQLSPYLVTALVATEDERFLEHSGIDYRGTARAIVKLGKGGGASTITQQLAKMLFTKQPSRNPVERIGQKIKEWVIAVRLERQYTKQEIVTMYYNKFDFLYQAIGIQSASKIYFDKNPIDLQLEEAALLVGMAKNPSLYNPRKFPKNALNRRNTVFNQMVRNNYLDKAVADSLKQLPIELNFQRESHDEGLATYFREYLRRDITKWLNETEKPGGGKYNLYRDGLKIYTTIDSRMQAHAEEAVREHMASMQFAFDHQQRNNRMKPFVGITREEERNIMNAAMRRSDRYKRLKAADASKADILESFNTPVKMRVFKWGKDQDGRAVRTEVDTTLTPMDSIRYYKSFLNTGLMAVEPQTGDIKAWVGGMDYKHFKYDHVKDSKRQVGSTFKPFVYATAIDQLKMSPCEKIPNNPVTFSKEQWGMPEDWTPKNSDGEYDGADYTLTNGLANSMNTITAELVKRLGTTEPIRELAKNLGVESPISPGPAMCLGTSDISVYEMVGAYSAFANTGVYVKPAMVLRIENKDGVVLKEFKKETRQVLSEEAAYVVVKLLEGVTQHGSGVRLRTTTGKYPVMGTEVKNFTTGYPYGFTNAIAGKTGTTQNHSDGWFMGMVPNLATGVWVGCDDRSAHFNSLYYGQGASLALPVWGRFMQKCYDDPELSVSKEEFQKPADEISIELDCDKQEIEEAFETSIEEEEF